MDSAPGPARLLLRAPVYSDEASDNQLTWSYEWSVHAAPAVASALNRHQEIIQGNPQTLAGVTA